MEDLKKRIRNIPDFPKKGILFRDITTLWQDGPSFRKAIKEMAKHYEGKDISVVVGAEARGFIMAATLAYKLGRGFVPIRKLGKLPSETVKASYELEYGTDTVEMHKDAFERGARVLIVDDLLATGGTAQASLDLVEKLGGKVVGLGFLVELTPLKGRERLKGYEVFSLIKY